MADLSMDVDAALSEVPINLVQLTDDGDFKTIEDSVAFDAAGLALKWNFVTTAGAFTQTAVTPTDTGGNYDWVNQGAGYYTIEIPASGGASINNDTEGFGWFSGVATGVLPWRGPIICFRSAALNNSLIDTNTTGLLAPTTAARTLDVTATGEAGIDWSNIGAPTTSQTLSGTTVGTATAVTQLTSTVADSVPADGTRPSIASGILMITRFLMESSVAATTVTVTKEDGSTASMTFTIDDATNPTSITRAS